MTAAPTVAERVSRAEAAIAEAAQRVRDLKAAYLDELERRDALIVEHIDAGTVSERRAAKVAGLSFSGLLHALARSG